MFSMERNIKNPQTFALVLTYIAHKYLKLAESFMIYSNPFIRPAVSPAVDDMKEAVRLWPGAIAKELYCTMRKVAVD